MKIDESQLNYVTQRTTQYDRKYGMLKNLLESIGRVDSAVELFGGIGLNSRYIQTYCSPKNHLAIEQDPDCFGFLTKSGSTQSMITALHIPHQIQRGICLWWIPFSTRGSMMQLQT